MGMLKGMRLTSQRWHWKSGVLLASVASAALVAGVFLLAPGASRASSMQPQPVPTTMTQIRADMRTHPALARIGLERLTQARIRAQAARNRSHPLTSAQVAALQKWAVQQRAAHTPPSGQKGPQETSGITAIRYGIGPWPTCYFYAHSLYISPPTGPAGTQYMVYAGNIPPQAACIDDPSSINVATAGYGGVIVMTYNGTSNQKTPPVKANVQEPLTVISASGNTVKLQTPVGVTYLFNFVTGTFVSS